MEFEGEVTCSSCGEEVQVSAHIPDSLWGPDGFYSTFTDSCQLCGKSIEFLVECNIEFDNK